MNTPIRFTRTDLSDGATETLTLVSLPEGQTLYCDALDRETPYAVLVEQGEHYARVWDLDGDEIRPALGYRDVQAVSDAPADVIDQIATGWETGTTSVERLTEVGPAGARHVLTPEEAASLAQPTEEERAAHVAAARDYLARIGGAS